MGGGSVLVVVAAVLLGTGGDDGEVAAYLEGLSIGTDQRWFTD